MITTYNLSDFFKIKNPVHTFVLVVDILKSTHSQNFTNFNSRIPNYRPAQEISEKLQHLIASKITDNKMLCDGKKYKTTQEKWRDSEEKQISTQKPSSAAGK